jgi:DNA-binding SARP family transcriptional activator/tetratricopeptide (TPR) repeat protein
LIFSSTPIREVRPLMLPYRLSCLGSPELFGPDGEPFRFRTRKQLALLIYLAMHPGQPLRRDRIATLLWGGASMDEARHSLAVALSALRGRLGSDAIEAIRDTVRLVPGRVVTDLRSLEADQLDDPELGPLGIFLDEFEVPTAPEFERWRDGVRARLLPDLCRCLVRRIERCRRTGDARRMEILAHQLHRIDGLAEEGARALMEARALAGDRIGALRIFDQWRLALAEELGAVPSADVVQLADRLRRRGLDRPTSVPLAPVPTEHWKERAFVGRGPEYAVCYAAWQRVRGGDPAHVLVRGESGLGKTTLVERVVTSVALEGASVARVRCHELERELPFGVIGSVVTQLLDLPGAGATAPEQLAELGRLVAKVRQRWPSLPAPLPVVGEGARIQFSEAVLALMHSLAEEQPLALVVDDIHLADATSLAVLHLLLRRLEGVPVMVLLTSAVAVADEAPSARRFVDNAEALRLTLVGVGPLPAVHAAELLDALVARDAPPSPTVRKALLAGARGNPMVLELLVADWQRRGDASLALSLGAMTAGAAGPPQEALRRVVGDTLAVLDPEARAVVELGAILGQRLNDLSMYMLVDLPVARTMRAMTTLTSHRVLRDAGSHLEFANEYMRGQCYVAMASPLRRRLHSLVADRLLAQDGADEPIPGLEVAWHLVRGDRLPEAVPYLLAGGRESIRRGAPHEADLALTTGLPALTGAPRRAAILLLAEALQELGRWGDSLQVLDTPCDPYDASEECCREVLRVIGRRWIGSIAPDELVPETAKLLEIASGESSIDVRVKALPATIRLLTLTRHNDHLARLGEVLVEIEQSEVDSYQRLHVFLARAWWMGAQRDLAGALGILDEAIKLADQDETRSSIVVRLLLGFGNITCLLGHYEQSLPHFLRAQALADRLDNETLQGECATQVAVAHGRLGDINAQIAHAREAVRLFASADWSPGALSARYELACGLALTGSVSEAQDALDSFYGIKHKHLPGWLRQAALLCLADVLALCGKESRAVTAARKAVVQLGPLMNVAYAGPYARWVARVGMHDKDPAAALASIRSEFGGGEHLDPKDRAEVLAAAVLLRNASGMDSSEDVRKLSNELSRLPVGIVRTMQQLRMLPNNFPGWEKQ